MSRLFPFFKTNFLSGRRIVVKKRRRTRLPSSGPASASSSSSSSSGASARKTVTTKTTRFTSFPTVHQTTSRRFGSSSSSSSNGLKVKQEKKSADSEDYDYEYYDEGRDASFSFSYGTKENSEVKTCYMFKISHFPFFPRACGNPRPPFQHIYPIHFEKLASDAVTRECDTDGAE